MRAATKLAVFATVPKTGADLRAEAFRCAARAAQSVDAVALASRWPRAGLFSIVANGTGGVSITHSAALAAAAACNEGPVGIDAEAWTRPAKGVERILASGEATSLFAAARAASFPPELAVWCAKEAVGKALGTGLTNSREWTLRPSADPLLWTLESPESLAVRLFRQDAALVAIALRKENLPQVIEITVL